MTNDITPHLTLFAREINIIQNLLKKIELACEGYLLSSSYANSGLTLKWAQDGVHHQSLHLLFIFRLIDKLVAAKEKIIQQLNTIEGKS